jgi:CDP-diacylglycerol--serine O-phosphatidyltransferase
MKKHIPNIITLANLVSGCIAITMAFQGQFGWVMFWVAMAAIFDFLDGMLARVLRAQSALGKELDSLADVVSFGVAPSMALFVLMRDHLLFADFLAPIAIFIPYLAFLIPAFSALRLAKFNVDDRQTTSFLGLPTPANGLFWASFCFGILPFVDGCYYTLFLAIFFIFVMSFLMISEIPMFSFKIKKVGFRGNERQIGIVVLAIALIALFGIIGIAMSILAYILLSILTKKIN